MEKQLLVQRSAAIELVSLYDEHGRSAGMRAGDELEKCTTIVTGTLSLLLGTDYEGVDEIASNKRYWVMSVFAALATNPLKPPSVDAAVDWLASNMEQPLGSFIQHYSQKIGEVVDFLHKMQHYHKNYTDLKDASKDFFDRLAAAFDDGNDCDARRMLGCIFNIDAAETDYFFIVLGSLFRHLLEYDVCKSMSVAYLPSGLKQIESGGRTDFRFYPSSWMWLISKPSIKCLLTAFATTSVTPPSWTFACTEKDSFPLLKAVLEIAKVGGQGQLDSDIIITLRDMNHDDYKVETLSGFCNTEDCNIFSALLDPVANSEKFSAQIDLEGAKLFLLKKKDGMWVCNKDIPRADKNHGFYKLKLGDLPGDNPVVAYARVTGTHLWIACTEGDSEKASILFRIQGVVDTELFEFYRGSHDKFRGSHDKIKGALEKFLNTNGVELDWPNLNLGQYRPTSILPSEQSEADTVGGEIIAFILRLVWEMACKQAEEPFVEAPLNAFGKDSSVPRMLPQPSMAFRELLKGVIDDVEDVPVAMQGFNAVPGKETQKALHNLVQTEMGRAPRALGDIHGLFQTFATAASVEKVRQSNAGAEILALLCAQFVEESPTIGLKLEELEKKYPVEFKKQEALRDAMLTAKVQTGASDADIATSIALQGGAEKVVTGTASQAIAAARQKQQASTRASSRLLAKSTQEAEAAEAEANANKRRRGASRSEGNKRRRG